MLSDLTQCPTCGNATIYCGCDEARFRHCTHPNQTWCDCDWCRVWRGYRKASKLGTQERRQAVKDSCRGMGGQ